MFPRSKHVRSQAAKADMSEQIFHLWTIEGSHMKTSIEPRPAIRALGDIAFEFFVIRYRDNDLATSNTGDLFDRLFVTLNWKVFENFQSDGGIEFTIVERQVVDFAKLSFDLNVFHGFHTTVDPDDTLQLRKARLRLVTKNSIATSNVDQGFTVGQDSFKHSINSLKLSR
jgi:hypothetical protein